MKEITNVTLENEMDLILAHKQSMRLAELTGLSLPSQTTFATAVSELCRSAIVDNSSACLKLYVSDKTEKLKSVIAVLEDKRKTFAAYKDDGYLYAKRLVSNASVESTENGTKIELRFRLPQTVRIDDVLIERLRINLNTDPNVSPYEEIKRKNRQLIEMADKLRESEQQYKSLTDSLPIMIFSMEKEGNITYANQWLHSYTGQTMDQINNTHWQDVVHADDIDEIWGNWRRNANDPEAIITPELRIKDLKTDEFRWHTGVSIPIPEGDGNVKLWNTFLVDIHDKKLIAQTLKDNRDLQEIRTELEEKITLLNKSNQQLEQFAYITSHDLQEPLRKIGFYSDFLNNKYRNILPDEARLFFDNMIGASSRMKMLVQDILAYSTVRQETFEGVGLNDVLAEVLDDLEIAINEALAEVRIEKLPVIDGNSRQLKQLFENILSNALKFSRPGINPVVQVSAKEFEDSVIIFVKDNGIGFEEKYLDKMFNLFQRLHSRDKFVGTGIGLAICKKIVDLHHGTITARGTPNDGSTFIISLPLKQAQLINNSDI